MDILFILGFCSVMTMLFGIGRLIVSRDQQGIFSIEDEIHVELSFKCFFVATFVFGIAATLQNLNLDYSIVLSFVLAYTLANTLMSWTFASLR
jgi:hypothetical protein